MNLNRSIWIKYGPELILHANDAKETAKNVRECKKKYNKYVFEINSKKKSIVQFNIIVIDRVRISCFSRILQA